MPVQTDWSSLAAWQLATPAAKPQHCELVVQVLPTSTQQTGVAAKSIWKHETSLAKAGQHDAVLHASPIPAHCVHLPWKQSWFGSSQHCSSDSHACPSLLHPMQVWPVAGSHTSCPQQKMLPQITPSPGVQTPHVVPMQV
jgi:hypothetical protein